MRRLLLQRLLEPSKAATLALEGNGRRLFHPGQYGGHSKPTQLKTEIQPQFVTDTLQNGATSFISFDAKTPVMLRMEEEYPGNAPAETVPNAIRRKVSEYPNNTAVKFKEIEADTEWKSLNYTQYLELIETVAKGFITLGLEESHSVGVMANNCIQWTSSSIGSIFAGGLICGIYQTSSSDIVAHLAKTSDMDILVVEDIAMLKQAIGSSSSIQQALPSVKNCVMIRGSPQDLAEANKFGSVVSWEQMLKMGKEAPHQILETRESRLEPNKACMLIFTSGTTGAPKGAMISHDNICYSCLASTLTYSWDQEISMTYLPMSHVAAHMIDGYMPLWSGGTVYFADKDCLKGKLVENLKQARPTRFVGVPRVWEKIKEKMVEVEAQASPVKKAVLRWAKAAALEHHQQVMSGKVEYGVENGSLKYRIAHKLVLSKIHAALGMDRSALKRTGRVSGAAAISTSTKKYFESIGLFIADLYGATEATGPIHTILEKGEMNKDGTVGKRFVGVKTHILNPDPVTNEGEVAIYTRNTFMGYLKEESKTRDAFTEDGVLWKSGDLGVLDWEGHLRITGRIKELIITQGGKNIAPVPIEDAIKGKLPKLISQVVVVGDNQKYLSCLITLQVVADPKTLLPTDRLDPGAVSWCKKIVGESSSSPVQTIDDFIDGPHAAKLRSRVQEAIDDYNASNAETQVHQIKKFCILPNEFSFSGGELGPTLKMKRHVISKKYNTYIDSMY